MGLTCHTCLPQDVQRPNIFRLRLPAEAHLGSREHARKSKGSFGDQKGCAPRNEGALRVRIAALYRLAGGGRLASGKAAKTCKTD